jgi:hypothetical protein
LPWLVECGACHGGNLGSVSMEMMWAPERAYIRACDAGFVDNEMGPLDERHILSLRTKQVDQAPFA